MNKLKIVSGILGLTLLLSFGCGKSDGFAPGQASTPDPASPAPVVPPPAVFVPTDITSLHTWFDASDSATIVLAGSQVTSWAAKNNSSVVFTQTSASARPLIQASGINGRSTVRFDGVNDFMQANINASVSASVTVSFVIQMNSFNSKIPFSFNTTTFNYGPDLYFYGSQLHWNTGDSGGNPFANSGIPTTATHIYTVKNDQVNNRSELYIDGAFVGFAGFRSSAISDFSSPRLFIGNWITGSYYIDGQFAELLVYNKVIDESERANLEAYLKSKWGVP